MKKIYTIVLALGALLATGCTRELTVDRQQDGDIHIRIGVDGLETKTAGTSEENAVNSLDVFVYKSDESTVLYYTHVSSPTFAAGGSYYEQTTNLAGLAGSPTEDEVKNAVVYAIANYNGPIAGTESLATLQALEVDASKFATPSPFVMTAQGGFASGGGNVTVASLQLKRLAAKVTLKLNIPASCTTEGNDPQFGATTTTWTPMTGGSNFKSMLQNAVGNTKLDGSAAAAPDVFSYNTQKLTNLSTGVYSSADFYTYPVSWTAGSEDEPFVKVVLSWSYVTTADSDGSEVDRNVVERYYKIVFSGLSELAANTWYQPEVTLKVLPGEGNEPVLVIPEGLQVQPWGLVGGTDPSASPISDVAMTDAKFITVIASNIEMTGEKEYTISLDRGIKSSFEVIASGSVSYELQDISFTKFVTTPDLTALSQVGNPTYAGTGKADEYIVQGGEVQSAYSGLKDDDNLSPLEWVDFTLGENGGTLELKHSLSSDMLSSKNFAVTDYLYKVKLQLDAENYIIVKINQSPAIQLTNQLSEAYIFINNTSNRVFPDGANWETNIVKDVETTNNFYMTKMVSGKPTARKKIGELVGPNLKGSGSKCKFRFLVDVVPFDTEHPITDTRAAITGDFAYAFTRKSPDSAWPYGATEPKMETGLPIEGNQYDKIADATTIKYKGATENKDYVSPGFMVASSYGGYSNRVLFGGALLRCATYQEDGYPAGRWRLPTEAELKFMVDLQTRGFMPQVFTDNTWASSGRIYNGSSFVAPTSTNGHTVRCVYDTWYWGKDPVPGAKETYTVSVTKPSV